MADKTNYVRGNAIFLYDSLQRENTAEMIGDLAHMVNKMPFASNYDYNTPIESPYYLNTNTPVIDVFINSPGGKIYIMNTIMTFLNIARNKGAIIRTTVTGFAASCASMIAIQGTAGFRIMYDKAYNGIHYGNSDISVRANGEIDLAANNEKKCRQIQKDIYKKFTNMTDTEINACMKVEHHVYSAKECLEKNICDWVLTDAGRFIQRNKQR